MAQIKCLRDMTTTKMKKIKLTHCKLASNIQIYNLTQARIMNIYKATFGLRMLEPFFCVICDLYQYQHNRHLS